MRTISDSVIAPFLITQIETRQNQYLICPMDLYHDREEFNISLYGPIENIKITESFLRAFTFNNSIIIAYYWLSDMVEFKSNRKGLHLIFGFRISRRYFASKRIISWYLDQYYKVLCEYCRFGTKYSDEVINALALNDKSQNDVFNRLCKLKPSYISKSHFWHFFKRNSNNKYTLVVFDYSLYSITRAFLNENFSLIYHGGDVSTNPNIEAPYTIIIKDAEKYIIPKQVFKIEIVDLEETKYLKLRIRE